MGLVPLAAITTAERRLATDIIDIGRLFVAELELTTGGIWDAKTMWDGAVRSSHQEMTRLARTMEHLQRFGGRIVDSLSPDLRVKYAEMADQASYLGQLSERVATDQVGNHAPVFASTEQYTIALARELGELTGVGAPVTQALDGAIQVGGLHFVDDAVTEAAAATTQQVAYATHAAG